ncbi:MAG: hypothetical protein ACI8U3_001811 [Brevundimonas sp.]|jgi:hypothetical protein|uniref:hypothetical protein n=1 Tax=Brevundimonas sp. TaxID=1871086 RepID=UPI0039E331C9
MSQTNAVTHEGRPLARSWRRFAGIVALYAVPGPLMGALGLNALLAVLAVTVEISRGNFDDLARLLVGGMVVGTIISAIIAYAFGMVSAAGVGLMVAIRDRRRGGISWRTSLIAALVFWGMMSLAGAVVIPPPGLAQWIGALLAAHALAAVACTWLARRLFC